MDLKRVDEIIDKYKAEKNWLIGIFQDIQQEYRYLPREAIGRVATRLDIPLTQAYMVATFYKSFSLVPRGEHEIHVCLGHRVPFSRRAAAGGEFRADPGGQSRGDDERYEVYPGDGELPRGLRAGSAGPGGPEELRQRWDRTRSPRS